MLSPHADKITCPQLILTLEHNASLYYSYRKQRKKERHAHLPKFFLQAGAHVPATKQLELL